MLEMLPKRARLIKSHRHETVAFHQAAVEKVIRLMRQDPGAKLNWNALARHAGISRYHFLRVFQEITHFTPHAFLVTLRLQMAKRLLLETPLPISHVCQQASYHSASTFVRIFKTNVGLVPTEFRRQIKKMAATQARAGSVEILKPPGASTPENSLQVDFKISTPFTGSIFVWFSAATTSDVWPLFGTVIDQAAPSSFKARVNLPDQPVGCLRAIAIPESSDHHHYLLPDEQTCLIASLDLSATHVPYSKQAAVLKFSGASLFDPPVLICLPVLLPGLFENRIGGS
jgi:AraC-like DNA-binding protein